MNNPAQFANAINPIRTSLAHALLRRGFFLFLLRLRYGLLPTVRAVHSVVTGLRPAAPILVHRIAFPLSQIGALVLAATAAQAVGPPPDGGYLNQKTVGVTFTDVSVQAGVSENNCSWGAAWADYDNDGYVDVMTVGHLLHPHVSICQLWHNNGDETFTDVTFQGGLQHLGGDSHGAVWGDLDGDGDLDLYVSKGDRKGSSG